VITINRLKHVDFYSKNKFENFMHLVGFVIRIKKLLGNYIEAVHYVPLISCFNIRCYC